MPVVLCQTYGIGLRKIPMVTGTRLERDPCERQARPVPNRKSWYVALLAHGVLHAAPAFLGNLVLRWSMPCELLSGASLTLSSVYLLGWGWLSQQEPALELGQSDQLIYAAYVKKAGAAEYQDLGLNGEKGCTFLVVFYVWDWVKKHNPKSSLFTENVQFAITKKKPPDLQFRLGLWELYNPTIVLEFSGPPNPASTCLSGRRGLTFA